MGLFCARVTVHSIGTIFMFLGCALLIAATAMPTWLQYHSTFLKSEYYLGLYEYCWKFDKINGVHNEIPLKCEFNSKLNLLQQGQTLIPTVIVEDLAQVSFGLIVSSAIFALVSGSLAAVGWCCKNICGVCNSVSWIICSFLSFLLNIVCVAYFILKTEQNTNMVFIDRTAMPAQTYMMKTGLSFYMACAAIGPIFVGFICAITSTVAVLKHRNIGPKPTNV